MQLFYMCNELNRIGGVMVSVFTSGAVDRGFEPRLGLTKDNKVGIFASPLSTQYYGVSGTTGWLGIRIMCPSGATCLSKDCCL
jgi:hypothetical protein